MTPERKDIIRVEDNYYILATSALADDRTRVLKHDDTFAIFDRYGDIQPVGLGEQGLYHEGTRFLNRLEFRLEDHRPLLLSSLVSEDNSTLSVDLANQDISVDGNIILPRDTLQVVRFKFIWKGASYERFWLRNFSLRTIEISFSLHYQADFRDIFEIRGIGRERRGKFLKPVIDGGDICLGYLGLDGVTRSVRLLTTPKPEYIDPAEMRFRARLKPRGEANFYVTAVCEIDHLKRRSPSYASALARVKENVRPFCGEGECEMYSSNQQFNDWIGRSKSDLNMMTTHTAHGPYPYAGVPWFSTAFGRDGIITAMEALWLDSSLARGVLSYLAKRQADGLDDKKDAEPGKILHEVRTGEMAALGEIPFGLYYGSIDSTPLFILLAGMYHERTADREFAHAIWPHVQRALDWIDSYGDIDGDGFVEYLKHSPDGLVHQGWKDSRDSVFHSDGRDAEAPIALCEVQAYVYAAFLRAADLARALGKTKKAAELQAKAKALRQKFEEVFWSPTLATYVMALDGKKRPCEIVTSNAGHCLFAGIATRHHAQGVARTLMADSSFSGWGIRTVADTEARYNPMSYHNGSVWPHDNALIAYGLSRYGLKAPVLRILHGLFEASIAIELHRLPELFCGFKRRPGMGPSTYPLACAPQAWASGSVFMILQACLGLSINASQGRIFLHKPVLPEFIDWLVIKNLPLGRGSVDMTLRRDSGDVSLNVTRRKGNVAVVVIK